MKTIFIILLIVLAIVFLVIYLKKISTSKLSEFELEYVKSRYIIKHKNNFTKKTIQKAQQFIDEYLSIKNN